MFSRASSAAARLATTATATANATTTASSSPLGLMLLHRRLLVTSNRSAAAAAAAPAAMTTSSGKALGEVRHDWTSEEVEALYNRPLLELVFDAATVHRQHHDPRQARIALLLYRLRGFFFAFSAPCSFLYPSCYPFALNERDGRARVDV